MGNPREGTKLNDIIQKFAKRMESRVLEITAELTQRLDIVGLEAVLNEECAKLNAEFQQAMLQALLLEKAFCNG